MSIRKKRFVGLAIALIALAIAAMLAYSWFTSTTGPISNDVTTAKIKITKEYSEQQFGNMLPGETVTFKDIKIKNESTRNAVAQIKFNAATFKVEGKIGQVFGEVPNPVGYPSDPDYFWANISEMVTRAADPNRWGGTAYITEAEANELLGIFGAARNTENVPVTQEVLDFLKICKDNNIGIEFDQVYNFNDSPICVAYYNFADKVINELGTKTLGSLDAALNAEISSNTDFKAFKFTSKKAWYVAFTPGMDDIVLDMEYTIPTTWGNEFQGMTIENLGLSVDAVQCTKEAVRDVFGLTLNQINTYLVPEFPSDFWTD
jgi:hypothetical protein